MGIRPRYLRPHDGRWMPVSLCHGVMSHHAVRTCRGLAGQPLKPHLGVQRRRPQDPYHSSYARLHASGVQQSLLGLCGRCLLTGLTITSRSWQPQLTMPASCCRSTMLAWRPMTSAPSESVPTGCSWGAGAGFLLCTEHKHGVWTMLPTFNPAGTRQS